MAARKESVLTTRDQRPLKREQGVECRHLRRSRSPTERRRRSRSPTERRRRSRSPTERRRRSRSNLKPQTSLLSPRPSASLPPAPQSSALPPSSAAPVRKASLTSAADSKKASSLEHTSEVKLEKQATFPEGMPSAFGITDTKSATDEYAKGVVVFRFSLQETDHRPQWRKSHILGHTKKQCEQTILEATLMSSLHRDDYSQCIGRWCDGKYNESFLKMPEDRLRCQTILQWIPSKAGTQKQILVAVTCGSSKCINIVNEILFMTNKCMSNDNLAYFVSGGDDVSDKEMARLRLLGMRAAVALVPTPAEQVDDCCIM